jgi:hypothetical protein
MSLDFHPCTEKNVYLGEQKILLTTTHILVCYDKAAILEKHFTEPVKTSTSYMTNIKTYVLIKLFEFTMYVHRGICHFFPFECDDVIGPIQTHTK